MKELRLPLKKKWFDLTKSVVKKEDYREINDYWCRRLLNIDDEMYYDIWVEMIEDLKNPTRNHKDTWECLNYFGASFVHFDINTMTLGYPKSTDTERILKLSHGGIEIRTGNPEWGAEPGKLYFVIKHGEIYATT